MMRSMIYYGLWASAGYLSAWWLLASRLQAEKWFEVLVALQYALMAAFFAKEFATIFEDKRTQEGPDQERDETREAAKSCEIDENVGTGAESRI